MAKALKALKLADWQTRVQDAMRDQEPWRKRSQRFLQYYLGGITVPVPGGSVVVNTVYKDIKTTIPAIFSNLPDVLVSPKHRNPLSQQLAAIAKRLLPYYLKELDLGRSVRRCLQDAKLSGMGVLKLGWSLVMAQQELSPEAFEQKDAPEPKQAALTGTPPAGPASNLATSASPQAPTDTTETPGTTAYVQERIQENEPWVLRWTPEDFLVDPEATSPDLKDARWIAFRKVMNKAEGEQQFGFVSKHARKSLKASATEDQQRLILWDVYDKLRQERRVFFEEEDFERVEPWEVGMDGFLCETITFNEIPDCPYGEPDVRFYEPQLIEKNDIRSQQMQHRRRFNTQTLYEEGAIKDTELAKAERNIEAAWIKVLPGGTGKILPKPIPALPGDVYMGERLIDTDLNELIGFSENQRGTQGPVQRTATESSIIENRARLRSGDRQQLTEIFLTRIMEKLWILLRQRLPVHRVEEIMGQPVPEWKNVSAEEAKKELEIGIVANSTLPKMDRLTRAQSDIQLIGTMSQWAPILAQQGTIVNLKPLVNETLELLDHTTTAEEILVSAPPAAMMLTPQIGGTLGGSPAKAPTNGNTPGEAGGRVMFP